MANIRSWKKPNEGLFVDCFDFSAPGTIVNIILSGLGPNGKKSSQYGLLENCVLHR
jgi:hypothetical protein